MASDLYRKEADVNQKNSVGESLIKSTLSFDLMVLILCIFTTGALIFSFTFEYTRRVRVDGFVIYDDGAVKIYSPTDGRVLKKFVGEGQKVHAGDPLYSINLDKQSSMLGSNAEGISQEINRKIFLLGEEMNAAKAILSRDKISLRQKKNQLEYELIQANQELITQEKNMELSNSYLERYKSLEMSGFISQAALQEKQMSNHDTQARYFALVRDRSSIQRLLDDANNAIANRDDNFKKELSQIDREISNLKQENVENETRKEITIKADVSGIVTGIASEAGQNVNPSQLLTTIVPSNLKLHVQLNLPASAVGMVSEGQKVLLRYSSFPYEKFGQFNGTIKSVSSTALSANELHLVSGSTQLLYPAIVELDSNKVFTSGKFYELKEGMSVDADILLEKRTLAEWAISPALAMRRYIN